MRRVESLEEEPAGDAGETSGVRVVVAGIDVLDELRPRAGAVGSPKLSAMRPADPCERVAGGDLLDELRPRASAVGFPERTLVARIEGAEEERAADVLQA